MDPYASHPDSIPATDIYADVPFYGRYLPRADDFRVDPQHVGSSETDSESYWSSVLALCDESNRIYPADDGGRDVFALGSVIVKSSHLHKIRDGQPTEIDYSYADANEVQAISAVKGVLNIKVPNIYFTGKIGNRQVLVQERIPGVGLNVAWPYLSTAQKESFKKQARDILRQMYAIKPTDGRRNARNHVVPDPNIRTNGRISAAEADILFSAEHPGGDVGLVHNDFTASNCIVHDDRIVGLVDWEMAGFFGWETAGEVHRRIRTPQREHFAEANLVEEVLLDLMWWNDLYD